MCLDIPLWIFLAALSGFPSALPVAAEIDARLVVRDKRDDIVHLIAIAGAAVTRSVRAILAGA